MHASSQSTHYSVWLDFYLIYLSCPSNGSSSFACLALHHSPLVVFRSLRMLYSWTPQNHPWSHKISLSKKMVAQNQSFSFSNRLGNCILFLRLIPTTVRMDQGAADSEDFWRLAIYSQCIWVSVKFDYSELSLAWPFNSQAFPLEICSKKNLLATGFNAPTNALSRNFSTCWRVVKNIPNVLYPSEVRAYALGFRITEQISSDVRELCCGYRLRYALHSNYCLILLMIRTDMEVVQVPVFWPHHFP